VETKPALNQHANTIIMTMEKCVKWTLSLPFISTHINNKWDAHY